VTPLNNRRYINNFIYLSIYLTTIVIVTADVQENLGYPVPTWLSLFTCCRRASFDKWHPKVHLNRSNALFVRIVVVNGERTRPGFWFVSLTLCFSRVVRKYHLPISMEVFIRTGEAIETSRRIRFTWMVTI